MGVKTVVDELLSGFPKCLECFWKYEYQYQIMSCSSVILVVSLLPVPRVFSRFVY